MTPEISNKNTKKEIRESFEIEMTEKRENFEAKMKEDKEAFDLIMKTEKESLANETASQREQWKAEKLKNQLAEKEYIENLQKQRTREEEEYTYNLKITRKKEEDAYNAKKTKLEQDLKDKKEAFEKEFSERENNIQAAEAELNELRKLNAEFPKQLEKALAAKEKEITEKLTAKFDFERQLAEKQYEGDLNLKTQNIATLKEKIVEMNQQIKELSQKASLADANVKDIAVKAIESSSKMQIISKESSKKEDKD